MGSRRRRHLIWGRDILSVKKIKTEKKYIYIQVSELKLLIDRFISNFLNTGIYKYCISVTQVLTGTPHGISTIPWETLFGLILTTTRQF